MSDTITSNAELHPPIEVPVPRSLALGLAGAVAFGATAGIGHGAAAMLRGAWMSPALFVGGALLATPPLYLASSWSAFAVALGVRLLAALAYHLPLGHAVAR